MPSRKQHAIVVTKDGGVELKKEIEVAPLGPREILVKVVATALNPTDTKTAQYGKKEGSISGCDFAGVVEELGPDVPAGHRKIGERVSGCIHGGCYPNGAFSEYLITDFDRVIPVLDSWSFEDAAQIGVAPLTATMTLWECHTDIPTPAEVPTSPLFPSPSADGSTNLKTPILIWGGATSVGNYAIQFARLAGLHVITTASPHNFDFLTSLGADAVYDYRDPLVVEKIKGYLADLGDIPKGGLKHAIDCVGQGGSLDTCAEVMGEKGGVVATIANLSGTKPKREDVRFVNCLAYDLFGKPYEWPRKWTPTPEDLERGRAIIRLTIDILATGKLKPSPTLVMPHGLASVPEGFKYMNEGKVSGQKVTFRIADTPGLADKSA